MALFRLPLLFQFALLIGQAIGARCSAPTRIARPDFGRNYVKLFGEIFAALLVTRLFVGNGSAMTYARNRWLRCLRVVGFDGRWIDGINVERFGDDRCFVGGGGADHIRIRHLTLRLAAKHLSIGKHRMAYAHQRDARKYQRTTIGSIHLSFPAFRRMIIEWERKRQPR
jgi:hypothetical protein